MNYTKKGYASLIYAAIVAKSGIILVERFAGRFSGYKSTRCRVHAPSEKYTALSSS